MATANDRKVWCDCPRFHKGQVTLRTRHTHRKAAGIIDTPDSLPLFEFHPYRQRRLDIDDGRRENGIRDNNMPEATNTGSSVIENTLLNDDLV